MMAKKRQTQQSKRGARGFGTGSQLDRMRLIRKDMPPATKIIQPKNHTPKENNWRDLIDDDEDYEEWE